MIILSPKKGTAEKSLGTAALYDSSITIKISNFVHIETWNVYKNSDVSTSLLSVYIIYIIHSTSEQWKLW